MDYIIVPIIWIVLIVLLIAFIASNIVIVPQAKAYVIERLGTYRDTWSTGLHFKVPLFEQHCPQCDPQGAGSRFPATAGYHQG